MRPPKATGSPFSDMIGNITRARNESCRRCALLVNARPDVAQHIGGEAAARGSSRPNRRVPTPT